MEARKYGIAAAIGGFLFCLCAAICVPRRHVLGLIASIAVGFAGGYLSYEFRDVLRAIPKAARTAWDGMHFIGVEFLGLIWKAFSHCFLKPHPIFYQTIFLSTLMLPWIERFHGIDGYSPTLYQAISWCVVIIELGLFISFPIVMTLAHLGSRFVDHKTLSPLDGAFRIQDKICTKEEWLVEMIRLGRPHAPITHANLFRWQLQGLWVIIKFQKYLAIASVWLMLITILGLAKLARFFPRFVIELLQLIHSPPRLVCGIYGLIGGLASYHVCFSRANTPVEKAMFLLCGTVFGGALGLVGRNLVMKRLLHIPVAVRQSNK